MCCCCCHRRRYCCCCSRPLHTTGALRKQLDLEDDDDWGEGLEGAGAPSQPPRTKALIIGIHYFGGVAPLENAIHDAERMRGLLTSRCGFSAAPDRLRLLKDNAPTGSLMPTRANMLRGVDWLVKGARPGDVLFFSFSGHGTQQPDVGAATDARGGGYEDCVVPCDHARAGLISDVQLFDRLVRPLPSGVRLTCLMDCGHACTGLDLPFRVTPPYQGWATEDAPLSLAAADVRLFSGCKGGEAAASGAGGEAAGLVTDAFIRHVTQAVGAGAASPPPRYSELLAGLSRSMEDGGAPLRCSLSASVAFDLGAPFDLAGAAASPQDTSVILTPEGRREERPADAPKMRRILTPRVLPAFSAPPKAEWQDAGAPRRPTSASAAGSAAAGYVKESRHNRPLRA